MKKRNSFLLISLLSLFFVILPVCFSLLVVPNMLSSCFWEPSQDVNAVVEIKIVDIREPYTYTVLKELDATIAPAVYDDIQSLKMHNYSIGLSEIYGKGFLIVFANGEYEILSQHEVYRYQYEDGALICYPSHVRFSDGDAFLTVVEKHLQ